MKISSKFQVGLFKIYKYLLFRVLLCFLSFFMLVVCKFIVNFLYNNIEYKYYGNYNNYLILILLPSYYLNKNELVIYILQSIEIAYNSLILCFTLYYLNKTWNLYVEILIINKDVSIYTIEFNNLNNLKNKEDFKEKDISNFFESFDFLIFNKLNPDENIYNITNILNFKEYFKLAYNLKLNNNIKYNKISNEYDNIQNKKNNEDNYPKPPIIFEEIWEEKNLFSKYGENFKNYYKGITLVNFYNLQTVYSILTLKNYNLLDDIIREKSNLKDNFKLKDNCYDDINPYIRLNILSNSNFNFAKSFEDFNIENIHNNYKYFKFFKYIFIIILYIISGFIGYFEFLMVSDFLSNSFINDTFKQNFTFKYIILFIIQLILKTISYNLIDLYTENQNLRFKSDIVSLIFFYLTFFGLLNDVFINFLGYYVAIYYFEVNLNKKLIYEFRYMINLQYLKIGFSLLIIPILKSLFNKVIQFFKKIKYSNYNIGITNSYITKCFAFLGFYHNKFSPALILLFLFGYYIHYLLESKFNKNNRLTFINIEIIFMLLKYSFFSYSIGNFFNFLANLYIWNNNLDFIIKIPYSIGGIIINVFISIYLIMFFDYNRINMLAIERILYNIQNNKKINFTWNKNFKFDSKIYLKKIKKEIKKNLYFNNNLFYKRREYYK